MREGEVEAVLRAEAWRWLTRQEERTGLKTPPRLRLVLESNNPREGVATNDIPRDFARRRYGVRYLRTNTAFCQPQVEPHPLAEQPQPKVTR